MSVLKSMIIAFAMYSRIPVPQFEWKEKDMRYSLCFFPWVGLIIGSLEYLWFVLCGIISANVITYSLISAVIPLIVTGGFHVDGYMDTMDALSSFKSKEEKLNILKDSHIGAFSVIMLLAYAGIYVAAVAALYNNSQVDERIIEKTVAVFALSFVVSRALSGISLMIYKAAKKDGTLVTFANAANKRVVFSTLIVEYLLAAVAMVMINLWLGLAEIVATIIWFLLYRIKSYKNFGGITGDTAGYFVCICENICAVLCAAYIFIVQ